MIPGLSPFLCILFQALPKLKDLEVLNLESCLIRTGGAKAISRALDADYPLLKVGETLLDS